MLRLEGLRKRFGDITAVDGLTLTVAEGEVLGFLGPNGAGKTTTLHMAVGQVAPDAGVIDIAGRGAPARSEARAHIGVATQALALYEEMTGRENLVFFGRLYGMGGRVLAARVDELLEWTGLADRAQDCVQAYSGGMKRRLNFAVAVVHEPQVVLLDEPTAGVDPQSRNRIFDLVRELKARGRTVVYTTHYMEEAQRLCDRVGVLDRGRLLALDTVDRLIEQHGGKSVIRVERAGGEERIETGDPLRDLAGLLEGDDVAGLHMERPDLEAVFLALTGRSLRD